MVLLCKKIRFCSHQSIPRFHLQRDIRETENKTSLSVCCVCTTSSLHELDSIMESLSLLSYEIIFLSVGGSGFFLLVWAWRGCWSQSRQFCWKQVKGMMKGTEPHHRNETPLVRVIPSDPDFLETPCKEPDYLLLMLWQHPVVFGSGYQCG